jgi:hypothetical protein
MRGTGIDSDVEIYATKQSNEHQYMELQGGGAIETVPTATYWRWVYNCLFCENFLLTG